MYVKTLIKNFVSKFLLSFIIAKEVFKTLHLTSSIILKLTNIRQFTKTIKIPAVNVLAMKW